jgi:hypothetical protein
MLLMRPRLDWKPELLLLRRPRDGWLDILLASSPPSKSELYEYPCPFPRPDLELKVIVLVPSSPPNDEYAVESS